jgi:hypothetical protein
MIMAENLIIAGSLQENNRKAGLASAGKWPARNQGASRFAKVLRS